eukprot:CAMPEP_0184376590 /NCGR_PEP_ID=MMETSP0007-20130409/1573_1 /TAXON_ID=97485 /ORGANISM="Prymnesium parvum, Strain Texoma1" /LENGTH=171 /DNA_ID=CAMNT_0026720187 /DNA_START=46 /DNA_END=561 /DNA_ORIENTATION=+
MSHETGPLPTTVARAQPIVALPPAPQADDPEPPAVNMTTRKYQELMERLVAKDYWDFSKGMPPRGEVQAMEFLYQKLLSEDITWRINPLSSRGKAQAAGKPFQGGLFLQYLRGYIRKKWDTAQKVCTGQGGESRQQVCAVEIVLHHEAPQHTPSQRRREAMSEGAPDFVIL